MLSVVEKSLGIVATIGYGFDPDAHDPIRLDLPNPLLDPINPQSPYAEEILALFKEIALDEVYEERLRRHYRMVKEAVSSPGWSSGRSQGGETRQRDASARQRRKQQKAARRGNRLR
jgi:hypothetical protein